jgi:hypothetical protein
MSREPLHGNISIELIPDGSSFIVLIDFADSKYETTVDREVLKAFAAFLLAEAEGLSAHVTLKL